MTKLTILQTHPIQYYAPIYCELSERNNIEINVIYLTDSGAREYFDPGFDRMVKWDIDLLTGYKSQVMQPGLELANRGFLYRNDKKLLSILKAEKPDYVLLYGYASLMNWWAWWYAWRTGIKILYTSDSNARIDSTNNIIKFFVKRIFVGTFISKVYRFLCPGEANVEYLVKYGAKQERIVWSPFAIDVSRFSKACNTLEREYDFIWIGKFTERKRCKDYLQALIDLKDTGAKFQGLLIGDGPCGVEILEAARTLIEYGFLEIRGFVNQSQVPKVLSKCDTLIFTSEYEPYGLMATEAAASGCALVVADSIGCVGASSSAQAGKNALIYEASNVADLVSCMRKCLGDQKLVASMQSESLRIASEHGVDKAAEIIESVIEGREIEYS